jgi:hypothetical protein
LVAGELVVAKKAAFTRTSHYRRDCPIALEVQAPKAAFMALQISFFNSETFFSPLKHQSNVY